MPETCLQDVLRARAASCQGSIICYPLGDVSTPTRLSYSQLHTKANHYAQIVRTLPSFRERHPVLLHLDEHWEAIVWFWAVLFANGLPVMSPPFSIVHEHRYQHILGLSNLLRSPICITNAKSLDQFDGVQSLLKLYTIEQLCHDEPDSDRLDLLQSCDNFDEGTACQTENSFLSEDRSLAMLMLTSGSTGNAKAVRLNHKQVITSISSKSLLRPLYGNKSFLNWIRLDHVASLVEIHLQALWLGADQVHVNTTDIVSSPKCFLDLLSRHSICHTFAPNFFLGRLVSTLQLESALERGDICWDLSNLQTVISGGEANDVETCVAAARLFQRYGACDNVITPGFGMTETCAGAIYNLLFPDYDLACGRKLASLGKCIKGIEMRVVVESRLAAIDEPGDLELKGDIVFDGYYRNAEATMDAFPARDSWFRTGDRAYIDSHGNLCLIGRTKEVININGVKTAAADIHSLVENTLSGKIAHFVVFPSRTTHTEQVTIGYVPIEWPHSARDMAKIEELATRACMTRVFARPLVFALKETSLPLLPSTSLGKISRNKMRSLFEAGAFHEDVVLHRQEVDAYRMKESTIEPSLFSTTKAESGTEALLIEILSRSLDISCDSIGLDTQVLQLGFTSLDLIRLKSRLEARLRITIPINTLIENPTARSLAKVLEPRISARSSQISMQKATDYNPVVTIKSSGTKIPLWLFHPGVGEVLVFLGLAKHLFDDDRPIYALRARGFEPEHTLFHSIGEMVGTYVQAIRRKQPQGPYALAGYSYGAMIAFETAKRLNEIEDGSIQNPVRFLASFNLPPHIKSRMRELHWNSCLLHLAQFLSLMTEDDIGDMERQPMFSALSKSDALAHVINAMDRDRFKQLGLETLTLTRWVDVAFGLQNLAVDYDPTGQVDSIDVFHAIPLKHVAASREAWVDEHLSKWQNFSRTDIKLYEVEGAHYTMIDSTHVIGFAVKLKEALSCRGV